jgi:hypothetical protein
MYGFSAAGFIKNFYIRSELFSIFTFKGESNERTSFYLGGNIGYAFSINNQIQNLRIELKTNVELIHESSAALGLAVLYTPNKKLIR